MLNHLSHCYPSWRYRLVLLSIYAFAAFLFTRLYLITTTEYLYQAPLERLTAFTADRPFQYRILVPLFVHWLVKLVPIRLMTIYALLTFLMSLALLTAFRNYLRLFMTRSSADFGSLLILYPLLWNYSAFTVSPMFYPSDIPAVLLFVLGLSAIAGADWPKIYLWLGLASLNRETSCFLILATCLIMSGKIPWKRLCLHLGAMTVIYFSFQQGIKWAVANNSGASVYFYVGANLKLFLAIIRGEVNEVLFATVSNCGFIWLLIPLAWPRQPAVFKRLLLIVPPFYLVMAVMGTLPEMRIFNELMPILTAPAVISLREWTELASSPRAAVPPKQGRD
jgi:hypothetical protein